MNKVIIDYNSGFCFGVIRAVKIAEEFLSKNKLLYCLGDIVHNNEELDRLNKMGLIVIDYQKFTKLKDAIVLIRAHGEPPETYKIAKDNNVKLIDTTCPVVIKLQKQIKEKYDSGNATGIQILIFGKAGHAEVIGLLGQTNNDGILISSLDDINKIDFSKPFALYSQTTQSLEEYSKLIEEIDKRCAFAGHPDFFEKSDTICRSVSNRAIKIQQFANHFDKIIFVSGKKSSNGLYLYELCKRTNPDSYFISEINQLSKIPLKTDDSVGICGATSTPFWLMEQVKDYIEKLLHLS